MGRAVTSPESWSSAHQRSVSTWRHTHAIVLLPGVAAVAVPAFILLATGSNLGWGLGGILAALATLPGLALIAVGFALWLRTVGLLARVGGGTLAPWDPPIRLVLAGPYGHLRNPMIAAVLAVLAGEAALFGSPALLIWLGVFFVINYISFRVNEEPDLERRFGDDYLAYKRNVPRLLPRRTPWAPPHAIDGALDGWGPGSLN